MLWHGTEVDRYKKEQAIDSTAWRDAIIWVIQAVRTAAIAVTLSIYLRTKTSLYINVNMSLDQSFSCFI